MERAAAGEDIAVTRWGKPYVKLVPAAPTQPELTRGEENGALPSSSRT
jgi:antitoxin (DNA-binding transcriptional repressor) of toxin-antitoxin stability system